MKVKKPSKAAVRARSILLYIQSTMIVAGENHTDPLTKNHVDYVKVCSIRAVETWGFVGDREMLDYLVFVNVQLIDAKLNKIWWLKANPAMNFPGMCYIGIQLLEDFMQEIKDPAKTRMLQDIHDGFAELVERLDPEGAMYLTQDRASEVTDTIYSVVGEN